MGVFLPLFSASAGVDLGSFIFFPACIPVNVALFKICTQMLFYC